MHEMTVGLNLGGLGDMPVGILSVGSSGCESATLSTKLLLLIHCFKKRHPFYFCKNLAKYYPISIIFGSSRPEQICNKNMHVYPPHLFTVLIPYLVKNYDLLTCVCIVLKSGPCTVCNKFARCHPTLIIFSRHVSEEFCNKIFTLLSPPNLTLCVVTVPCKASNNLRACQSRSAR